MWILVYVIQWQSALRRRGRGKQDKAEEKKKKKLSKNMDLASDYCQIDPMEKI